MPETFQFEQLDAETRAYLLLVRDKAGQGVPGIYVEKANYLPVLGLCGGFGVVIATVLMTFPPTDEPAKEALLQTAGVLLGAWLIVAALRVWFAGKAGSYAGHFVYADPETLYEASGSTVRTTSLVDLREAQAVPNFNEGNYKNTAITVKVGGDRTTFSVADEERGRRLTVFLNALAYMRNGGEDGTDPAYKALTPEQMGAMAREVARTGQFPRSAPDEGREVTRVPQPRADGRASTGLLAILFWGLVGVGMYFGFRTMDAPFRDDVIFARIQELPARDRPWALRMYLAEPAFTAHRERAQEQLSQMYDANVGANVKGNDAQLAEALRELVLSLKTREPVVSLITGEDQGPALADGAGPMRETALRNALADKLGSTIGDELVVFAAPTKEQSNAVDTSLKGMLDVRWKFVGRDQIEYTVEFRKTPDDAPYLSKKFTLVAPPDPTQFATVVGTNLVHDLVGVVRPRPIIVDQDF